MVSEIFKVIQRIYAGHFESEIRTGEYLTFDACQPSEIIFNTITCSIEFFLWDESGFLQSAFSVKEKYVQITY